MTALGWLLSMLALLLSVIGNLLKALDWLADDGNNAESNWERARCCLDAIRRDCVRECWEPQLVSRIDARPWISSLGMAAASVGIIAVLGLGGQFLILGTAGLSAALLAAFLITLLFAFILGVVAWRLILLMLFACRPQRPVRSMIPLALMLWSAAMLLLPGLFVTVELAVRYPGDVVGDSSEAFASAMAGLANPGSYLRAALTHWLIAVTFLLPLSIPLSGLLLWSLIEGVSARRTHGVVDAVLDRLLRSEGHSLSWVAWALIGLGGIVAGVASQVGA